MASLKIGSGSTPAGTTKWKQYPGGKGVFVDISTSAAGFSSTPQYLTSIGGSSSHWSTTGATSIYSPSSKGFRVYVRWANGNPLTPSDANRLKWHINWVGIES